MIGCSSGNEQDFDTSSLPYSGQHNMIDHKLGGEELVKHNTQDNTRKSLSNKLRSTSNREEQNSDVQRATNKKSFHHHNRRKIEVLESFFKDFPHPKDKQKKLLADQLNLDAEQVKFWFQNKRTQMKKKQEYGFLTQLRHENQRVKAENLMLKNNLLTAPCLCCGGASDTGEVLVEKQNLLVENSWLRVKIDKVKAGLANYQGTPAVTVSEDTTLVSPHLPLETGTEPFQQRELIRLGIRPIGDSENQVIARLAVDATAELVKMTQRNGTLWIPDVHHNHYILNEEEYYRTVSPGTGLESERFKCEASRETTAIMADANNLVGLLMDVNKWSNTFSEIISRAMSIKILSAGEEGSNNGMLKVIIAELQALSPLVPTRKVYFVRYCKYHDGGFWTVTDTSLEDLRADLSIKCRKRLSGCLIRELPHGYLEVTWVEHFEGHGSVINNVNSDVNFGAKRWVSILARQYERQRSATMQIAEYPSAGGRRNIFLLADRMVIDFCGSLCASYTQAWEDIPGNGVDDMKLMFQKRIGYPGRLSGVVVKASTSFGLPCSPSKVLDFLSDTHSRTVWDVIFYGGSVQEIARFNTGQGGNCIYVMHSVGGINNNTMMIQETRKDSTGSLVVFAPIDSSSMDMVMSGSGNPNAISLLPSGVSILPDYYGGCFGSLITVTYQILADPDPTKALPLESVRLAKQLVARTVDQLKFNLGRT